MATKHKIKWRRVYKSGLTRIACIVLLPTPAFAAITDQDVQQILTNLQSILNPAMSMLLAISFVMGVLFILKALLALKAFAMPQTQMSRPGELSGPLILMFVGTILIYVPTSTNILSNTLFGSGNSIFDSSSGAANLQGMGSASQQLMDYAQVTVESQWATMIDTIVLYMEFIGFLAFLRGWVIIAHIGQHSGQPGTLSKGLVHIIGGILAINFLPLVNVLMNTIQGSS